MIEALKTFQLAIKQQGHVLSLMEHINLRVNLVCEQKIMQIIIKDGDLFTLYAREDTQAETEIHGDLKAIKQLLEGKERLRVLERNGQLTVSAPLRTTLLLESIFYLTKAEESFLKII